MTTILCQRASEPASMIDVALCTDNNYAMPSGVMMCSVCRNSGPARFHVIVPDDFSPENKRKLEAVAVEGGSEVHFITIGNSSAEGFPVGREDQPEHISIAAYYRLFLSELLPDSIDKVLYLDCDILCMSSLKKLWDSDIDARPLACISDISYTGVSEAERLGYDPALGYFNSGVLLVNLKYWRENNVKSAFIQFVKDNAAILRFHDQDVLNCVFKGQCLFLQLRYNAQDRLFHRDTPLYSYSAEEVDEARRNPVIVHFTYRNKPWFLGGTHPYQGQFIEYKSMTPWKNTRLRPKKVTTLRGHLINALVLLGLYKYHDDYISI